MRTNKYNNLAMSILIVSGIINIIIGGLIHFLIPNGNDITYQMIRYLGSFLFFAGIVSSLLGIIVKISEISRKNTILNLKTSGKMIYATNLKVWKMRGWGVDKKHWCNLICSFEDPITHQKFEFKSDSLWVDIEPIIKEKKIEKIPVYIDTQNPKTYFVDVDSIPGQSMANADYEKDVNNYKKAVLITIAIVLLVICGLFIILKVSVNRQANELDNNPPVNVDNTLEDECKPFYCYDDVSNVESKDLISKANMIDERLRKVLVLISIADWNPGVYTLEDVDKYALHSLIANRFFNEDDYSTLELGIMNATLNSSDYENIFTQITGIENIKSYFADYELKDIKSYSSIETFEDMNNSKQYIFTKNAGKTYYLVPFGIGMELGVYGSAVISDITVEENITKISIKRCDIDYENNTYICTAITTFEIETNGLRVYRFNVKK